MERRFSVRRFYAVVAATAAVSALLSGQAEADVLVESVPARVCLGKSFTVGVWYQSYSGGPRDFSIEIYDPRRRLVLYRKGLASSARWKVWRCWPNQPGHFGVVYSGRGFGSWSRSVRAIRCT